MKNIITAALVSFLVAISTSSAVSIPPTENQAQIGRLTKFASCFSDKVLPVSLVNTGSQQVLVLGNAKNTVAEVALLKSNCIHRQK